MQWKKDPDMKYTDMCIYIDENMWKLKTPGEYPDDENLIWNYLWLLIKALAIKKRFFNSFTEYDPYSFYAATRVYTAIQRNLQNQGKVIKGREIRPIKSCLNYTKMLLYPMKIEYQQQAYSEIISEEFVSKKFDVFALKDQLKGNIASGQGIRDQFWMYLGDSLSKSNLILDQVMEKTPFMPGTPDYEHLRISILMNCIAVLNAKHKLDDAPKTIILWKLPKLMNNYVKVLIKEFITALKLEIMDCYRSVEIKDDVLDKLLQNGEGDNYEEYQFN